ncbi:MAG: ABC transporter permease [Acetobacteraceae bacterium]
MPPVIATMQGNEEIDALKSSASPSPTTFSCRRSCRSPLPCHFFISTDVSSACWADSRVAIAMLDITGIGYLYQTLDAVPFGQFVFGFVKSIAFALLIGVTSCRIGLKAGRSAADVGVAATRAVVVGIVGVIAMDAVFAVIADVAGI